MQNCVEPDVTEQNSAHRFTGVCLGMFKTHNVVIVHVHVHVQWLTIIVQVM